MSQKIANHRAQLKARTRKGMIGGILKDECPKAIEAGAEAYLLCYLHHTEHDLRDFLLAFQTGGVSHLTFYTRFARICECVLEERDVPEDLVGNLHYAWGYFQALRREHTPQFKA